MRRLILAFQEDERVAECGDIRFDGSCFDKKDRAHLVLFKMGIAFTIKRILFFYGKENLQFSIWYNSIIILFLFVPKIALAQKPCDGYVEDIACPVELFGIFWQG